VFYEVSVLCSESGTEFFNNLVVRKAKYTEKFTQEHLVDFGLYA
jgi:hypothetical protein